MDTTLQTQVTYAICITSGSPIPNFAVNEEELWKLRVQILVSPSLKYGFQCADFHQTQGC
jgi:hypothetical protein